MAKTETAIVTEMRCGTLMPVALALSTLVLQGTFAVCARPFSVPRRQDVRRSLLFAKRGCRKIPEPFRWRVV